MKKFFLFLVCISQLIFNLSSYQTLNDLALKYGTDKGPTHHNYTPIYEKYFKQLRNKKINFLEIGFFKGASAKMWDKYFPNASLHFIDIDKNSFAKYGNRLSKRCSFFVADQENEKQLNDFIKKERREFDIIIDDGGHHMNQQIVSFLTLFPHLKKGGIYVIEDLHTSYDPNYKGGKKEGGQGTTVGFLQNLINDVNKIGALTWCADILKYDENKKEKLTYFQKHIESIHFYNSLCFIFKI